MIITKSLKLIKLAGLIIGLSVGLGACSSSDQQQEDGQENLESDQEDNAQEANQQGDQEENEEYNAGENEDLMDENTEMMDTEVANAENNGGNELIENTDNMAMNNEGGDNAMMNNMAEGNNMVEAAPVDAAPVDPSGRVVRFITSNDTPVFSQADSGASAVATMWQGDTVVVSINGSWAQIGEGRYISADKLSEQAVPRARTSNAWN